jgi:predicted O-linked N-acetylglucosamine transferase (SPINDLY family)
MPVFLPSGYLMYSPPDAMPEVSPLPALRNGYVTFGMFQRRAKTNGRVWDAVAAILRRCPGSKLTVQTGAAALDYPSSPSYREMRELFAARGIEEDRVRLIGKRPQYATLQHMSEVDIALDTFPYQGQTTTCECLWMGVPVVALSGEAHVARVGTALLERAGLGELAASTPEGYVETAVRLAADLPTLARMRAGMRELVRSSTLLDGRRLAAEVESAYRWMWTRWIETGDKQQ